MSALVSPPRKLQVMQAFVDVVKRVPGMRGAGYDVPFDFERKNHPFAYVYDTGESYSVEAMSMHSDNTLEVETSVVFQCAESPGKTPLVLGNIILADVLRELAKDYTLGGVATNTLPQGSIVRQLAGADHRMLAAVTLQHTVRYTSPLREPYGEFPPQ